MWLSLVAPPLGWIVRASAAVRQSGAASRSGEWRIASAHVNALIVAVGELAGAAFAAPFWFAFWTAG
ncbi:MAG: hypothetical protein DWQ34_01985 [Planctomycetota bacterium]|nr:MAG: hypothetical protein DWQ29_01420 [Planctomycetota bacterium]REJ97536.1 MAG: hypothetical protein DWQ34_01985 [Planctomycetota bacterium]REK23067.1 MAG: hypothetical protein DWQ41_18000 [Planctomycetota bacterium]REK34083.1 MAG: hypothetical protein DWQ45_14030 [Planctomycetota bacterium]